MYRRILFLGGVGLFVTIAASALAEEAAETLTTAPMTWQNVARSDGESLYGELCSVCHGDNGKGDGAAATALKQPVPDLTSLRASHDGEFPRQQVVDTITGKNRVVAHGTAEMPIWGKLFSEVRPDRRPFHREVLGQQRIYNLATYLESIQSE